MVGKSGNPNDTDLIAKGFKLVTVSELAEAKGKTLQSGNAYYYFGEGEQQVE